MSLVINYRRLEIILAILLALLAAGGAWYWMSLWGRGQELVSVVAAASNLNASHNLSSQDVMVLKLPRQAVPATAILDVSRAVGQRLARSKAEREILTVSDLWRQRDPSSDAALVPPGHVGFTIPSSWLAAPMPRIRKNDFVTIYGAGGARATRASEVGAIVRVAPILSITADKDGTPLLVFLAVDEGAVGRLLQAHAAQFQLIMVVESVETMTTPNVTSS